SHLGGRDFPARRRSGSRRRPPRARPGCGGRRATTRWSTKAPASNPICQTAPRAQRRTPLPRPQATRTRLAPIIASRQHKAYVGQRRRQGCPTRSARRPHQRVGQRCRRGSGVRRRIPGVERRTLRILALALVACGGEARSASAATVAATPEVVASLRADLVTLIERDAQKLENVCNASALVIAIRVASGDVVVRLRERVPRVVAPALVSGQPDCLVDIAARLVPLVPDTDKRKLIASLATFYEKGIKGWGLYRTVMPSIAAHLTAEESARFARVARAESASSCLRTIILAHLADAGRVPPAEALTAIQASRHNWCLERDELGVLRLGDDATLRALYPQEMALLDEPPARFGYGHVEALALLAPYLDARRRRVLLAAAFRAMPTIYVADRNGRGHDWGELPPQVHFWAAMTRLAPVVDG